MTPDYKSIILNSATYTYPVTQVISQIKSINSNDLVKVTQLSGKLVEIIKNQGEQIQRNKGWVYGSWKDNDHVRKLMDKFEEIEQEFRNEVDKSIKAIFKIKNNEAKAIFAEKMLGAEMPAGCNTLTLENILRDQDLEDLKAADNAHCIVQ